MKKILIIGLSILLFAFSCEEKGSECFSGTVLYQISCMSENGPAFLIQIRKKDILDTIATTTLPKTYQTEGQKIFFNPKEYMHPVYCTQNIIPPKVCDIYNVSVKSCITEIE